MSNFPSEIQEIIAAHMGDFNCTNYEAKLKEAGGYNKYVDSLGGIFKKYRGFSGKIETTFQLQEVCQYVWGLMSIFGFDYNNGSKYVRWTGGYPFYVNGREGVSNGGKIDDLCGSKSKGKTTCCNYAVDTALKKMGLLPNGSQVMCTQASYGKLITSKSDLKIGDIVHFYKDPKHVFKANDTSTYKNSGWHHVVIVYDVTDTAIIVADGGSRFMTNKGKWLYSVSKTGTEFGGDYGTTDKWMARRIFDLKSIPSKEGKTTTDLALECIFGRDINGLSWGNNPKRAELLGEYAPSVQVRINELLGNSAELKLALTKYILEGKASSGEKRKEYLGEEYWQLGQAGVNETRAACVNFLNSYDEAHQELIMMYLKTLFE